MTKDLDHAQQVVGEWGIATFPQGSRTYAQWQAALLANLREEVSELEAACAMHHVYGEPSTIAEAAADCLLLLLQLAHREGFSLFDASAAKYPHQIAGDELGEVA